MQDHQIRINEILDVAEKCFIQKGYHKTTISLIASEMKVAKGLLYYYFESKENLLEGLLKRHADIALKKMTLIVNNQEILVEKKISITFELFLSMVLYENGFFVAVLNDEKNSYIKERIISYVKPYVVAIFKSIIIEGNEKKVFKVDHEKAAAEFLFTILDFLIEMKFKKLSGVEEEAKIKKVMAQDVLENLLHCKKGLIGLNL